MATEEAAQDVGMGRMAQPDQSFGVELASPLAAKTQRSSDFGVDFPSLTCFGTRSSSGFDTHK